MNFKYIRENIEVSYSLLRNASDCIEIAVDLIAENGNYWSVEKELKSALTNIQNAIELLLKSRVAYEDYTLVVEDSMNISYNQLKNGNFRTITVSECIKILKKAPFFINLKVLSRTPLSELKVVRNKVTHYNHKATTEEFMRLISFGLDFCIEFYNEHILSVFNLDEDHFSSVDFRLRKIEIYSKIRLSELRSRYNYLKMPITYYFHTCHNCWQDCFVINSATTVKCLFCKDVLQIKDMVEWRQKTELSAKQCPECEFESMAAIHEEGEAEAWQCIICAHYTNYPENWLPNGTPLRAEFEGLGNLGPSLRWKVN